MPILRLPIAPLALLAGCLPGPRQHALPPTVAITPDSDTARLLLVGDTGAVRGDTPGDPAACDPSEGNLVISADCRERLMQSMAATAPDATVALGDLVYWAGPTCPDTGLTPDARDALDHVLGDYLIPVGAPVLLALGNHDLGQRHGKPRSLRCYLDYAEEKAEIVLPDRTFVTTVGPVWVGVLDSNRPPSAALTAALLVSAADHRATHPNGWVMLAAHHPYRTYRDNAFRPARMRRWVQTSGIAPDLYAQGHAHFLQQIVIDGLPVVTSGAGSKALPIRTCGLGSEDCGPGELFSYASWGFVSASFTDDELVLDYHDLNGTVLWRWGRPHTALTDPP